eukprot:409274-Amphidinium_carterae.1
MSATVTVSLLALASSSSNTRSPPIKRRGYEPNLGGQVAGEDELQVATPRTKAKLRWVLNMKLIALPGPAYLANFRLCETCIIYVCAHHISRVWHTPPSIYMLSDACDSNLPFAAWLKCRRHKTSSCKCDVSVGTNKGETSTDANYRCLVTRRSVIYHPVHCVAVLTPNRELEQQVAIPSFQAARRPRLSPRAAQGAPYAVARRVVRTTHSGQPSSVWTRGKRLHSEVEEVQALGARLECTEHNLRDLARAAEYEHGTAQTTLRKS